MRSKKVKPFLPLSRNETKILIPPIHKRFLPPLNIKSFLCLQESLSTDPLLPSPGSESGASVTSGHQAPIIPPPKLYTDHVLPLNPASLTTVVTRPSSSSTAANFSSSPLYAVSNENNTGVESKTFNSSEISVWGERGGHCITLKHILIHSVALKRKFIQRSFGCQNHEMSEIISTFSNIQIERGY